MRKTFKKLAAYLIMFTMVFGILSSVGPFFKIAQAATDSEGFTIITSANELDTVVRNNLSGKFRLGADIDLSEYGYTKSTWTAKKGWDGIGTSLAKGFSGTFDGNGYTIKGLWSKDRGSNQGLFRWLNNATIKNLTVELTSAGITGSGERKGGLTGNAYYGTLIENCNVVGSGAGSPISGSANYIAGLVGVVYKSEVKSSAAININCSGYSYVAGFLGAAHGASIISDSYATGSASANGSYAGGFAGAIYEASYVENSYATGSVYAKLSYAGGFAAVLYGAKGSTMFRCFAFGNVRADLCYAGGLLGDLYDNSVVEESCAYGDVSAKGYCVGGLIGEVNRGTIKNSYAQGNVSGTTGTGGLVGYFSSAYGTSGPYNSIENSYSSGKVSGKGTTEQGAYSGMTAVKFYGTNYYDETSTPGLRGYGSSGKPSNHGGNSIPQGKDTVPMMKQETFEGWNFDTIWEIDENETYPYFVWMPGRIGVSPEVTKVSKNLTSVDDMTYVNDIVEYTITSANNSKFSTWNNVTAVDVLPEGITFVAGSVKIDGVPAQYTYDNTSRTLAVLLGNIGLGEKKIITFNASINEDSYGLTIQNGVTIRGKDSEIGNNKEENVKEPDGGKFVEEKKTKTITGLVTPFVYDDLGYGDSFLEQFNITVELRETVDTPAEGDFKTIVKSHNNNIGTFQLENIPVGEYVLYISRVGYLERYMSVVISEEDPDVIQITAPDNEIIELWAGDTNMSWVVDITDIMIITSCYGATWGDSKYIAQADLNGDGIINQMDADIAIEYLDLSSYDYLGMGGIELMFNFFDLSSNDDSDINNMDFNN